MKPTTEQVVASYLDHYNAAPQHHNAAGERWYRESQRFARRLARETGLRVSVVAGVTAAMSPRVQWTVNKRAAEELCREGVTTLGLPLSREKASRILMGESPLRVLGGRKTTEFYRAIMGNENAAVIDTWMCKAAGWPHTSVGPKDYDVLQDGLRKAAALAGVGTATFQAVVWTAVRGGAE